MPANVPGKVARPDNTIPATEPSPQQCAPEPERSRRVGPYRLLHPIGEGGMGEVWVAEQVEPVRRRVALKVIKAGMDTKQVVARFEAERQALALMDHRAIAKVLDGGSTPEGRPYFVMEYVAGVSITEHCDTYRLPTEERLRLFTEVCEGVQHAHQKAIIHRDLKPSNILVSLVDGRAQPRIIDFGIAKATGQRLTEKTLLTEVGSVIGTPEYMSPEQADLTGQDVDTRTDVYSLGVILYELLTGDLPFSSKELRCSSYEELRRMLREVDPPRPSTRLSTGQRATELARKRETDPGSLRRQLEGDLDAITMKALEKDRARRYGTPSELAADITRCLQHQPVLARPASGLYRVHKYVRRHRLGVAVCASLLLLLIAFATTLILQIRRVATERDRANAERERANTWIQHAREFAPKPKHDHASGMKDMDPDVARTLDALLWKARTDLDDGRFAEAHKLLEDTLQFEKTIGTDRFRDWTIGQLAEAKMELGRLTEAQALLEQELKQERRKLREGPNAHQILVLARVLVRSGKLEQALALLRQISDEEPLYRALALPMYSNRERIFEAPDIKALRQDSRVDAIAREELESQKIHGFLTRYPSLPPFAPGMQAALGIREPANRGLRWFPKALPRGGPPFDSGPSTKGKEHVIEVCRALYTFTDETNALRRTLLIGKTWEGMGACAVQISNLDVHVENYELLRGPAGEWKPAKNHSYPPYSLIAGYSPDGIPYLVCQAKTPDNGTHPGTLAADGRSNCRFIVSRYIVSFNVLEQDTYSVLTVKDRAIPNTGPARTDL